MTPATTGKTTARTFETSPWSGDSIQTEATRVDVAITGNHVSRARWARHADPVSLAVNEILRDGACADLFWNSDGFHPRGHDDDARLGVHVEDPQAEGGEVHYWQPLPRRAERALKKLYVNGTEGFRPVTIRLYLPARALKA